MTTAYAPRYARALLDTLEDAEDRKQSVDQGSHDLGLFAATWRESPELRAVYLDPSIPAAKKIQILDRVNERLGMSMLVRNFLAVILNHERMEAFDEMHGLFEALVRGELGVRSFEWVSARMLDPEEQQAVRDRIAAMTGGAVEASFRQDPELLGGAQLRLGSTIYDGSVRGRLDALKQTLAAT